MQYKRLAKADLIASSDGTPGYVADLHGITKDSVRMSDWLRKRGLLGNPRHFVPKERKRQPGQ